jgi:hypothetical protein
VRFVLPNATGSGVDAITRAAQQALAKALGHPVIVDNQPGAGGILGLQTLTRAAPDGLTLGIVSNNVVIFPSVLKSMPFDMPGDFTPIAVVGYTPVVLVVNPKVPAKDAKEFVALLKSRNGDMTYASGGNGTILHLASEMFLDEAKAKARHIPVQGRRPDGDRPDRRPGRLRQPSRCRACRATSSRARCARSASRRRSASAPRPRSRPSPSRACRTTSSRRGSRWSARRACRRPRCSASTPRSWRAFADAEVKEAMAKQGNVINVGRPTRRCRSSAASSPSTRESSRRPASSQ